VARRGVETIGGLAIRARLATSWASLFMIALRSWRRHSPPFWEAPAATCAMLQTAHFEKNLMTQARLPIYVAGGGPYSLDRWRRFH